MTTTKTPIELALETLQKYIYEDEPEYVEHVQAALAQVKSTLANFAASAANWHEVAKRLEMAHKKFVDACADCGTDPFVEQGAILSVGSEFLPAHAQTVRDGGEPTAEYWEWLTEQTLQAQSEHDAEVAAGRETTA